MRPLALSDHQLALVTRAASTLPPSKRDEFLRRLAERLGSEPSDMAVEAAINLQLAVGRVPSFVGGK